MNKKVFVCRKSRPHLCSAEDFDVDKKGVRRKTCRKCSARNREEARRFRATMSKQGRCQGCGRRARKGKTSCVKCQDVNTRNAVSRYQKAKTKAVILFGGRCARCRLRFPDCVFDFHHEDPGAKESAIVSLLAGSWERCLKELKKCVMLCANCHRIQHHV